MEDFIILAVTDHYWGSGATVHEAVLAARNCGGPATISKYRLYVAPPGTKVDQFSRLVWTGFEPRLICERRA